MAVFKNVMVYLGLGPDEEYDDGYLYDEEPTGQEADAARRPVSGVGATAASGFPGTSGFPSAAPVAPPDLRRPSDETTTGSAVGAVRPLRPVADPAADVLDLTEAEDPQERSEGIGAGRFDHDRQETNSWGSPHRGTGTDRKERERTDRLGGRSEFGGPSRVEPVVRAVPIPRTKPLAIVPETFADAKTIADEFKRSVPVIMNLQGLDRELARRLIDFASGVCYSMSGSMEKIASQVFLLTPKSVEVSDEDMRRIEERGYSR